MAKKVQRKGYIGAAIVAAALWIVGVMASENIAEWLEERKLNRLLVLVENPLVSSAKSVLRLVSTPPFTHFYAAVAGAVCALMITKLVERRASAAPPPILSKPDTTLAEAVRYVAHNAEWTEWRPEDRWKIQLRLDLTDALFHGDLQAFGRAYNPDELSGPMYEIPRTFWETARIDVEGYLSRSDDSTVLQPNRGFGQEGWSDVRVHRSELERCFPRKQRGGRG